MNEETPQVVYHGGQYVLNTHDWLSSCCGARAVNKPTARLKFIHPGKGIRVFVGKHGEEADTGKTYLSHVETSAGPLTITIKYE